MKNKKIKLFVCLSFMVNILLSQDTIKTITEDEIDITYNEKLKELQLWDTIYFRFDGGCLQRKEIQQDVHGKSIMYFYELTKQKYIVLRHSSYKDFDTFKKGEKMEVKHLTQRDLKNLMIVDLNFILENGLKETYFASSNKKYFLIDETVNVNGFTVYEVVINSSF